MGNFLLDGLAGVGYALDTPGAYLRGAMAGRAGDRVSGEELLSSYGLEGGPLGGLAAEMVIDPLTLLPPVWGAVKGTNALTKGARALGSGASPLARLAEEAAGSPLTRRLGDLAGPSPLDRRLGELGGLADPMDRLRAGYRHTEGAPDPSPLTKAMDFFADESGAVKLSRWSDPEVVNATSWLHGSGTPGLTADVLDPRKTRAASDLGRGVYLTNQPETAAYYASMPRADAASIGSPTVYGAGTDVGRILDLSSRPPEDFLGLVADTARTAGPRAMGRFDDIGTRDTEALYQLLRDLKAGSTERGSLDVLRLLREHGYDALSQAEPGRDFLGRTLVALDPNDLVAGVGRSGQITRFTPGG